MDWKTVAESVTASGPMALVLGAGCAALWRAWASERAEVKRLNDERMKDLRELLK